MTKEELIDLIKDAGYCVLATAEKDQPKARPMMPFLNDDGQMLLACLPNSRTIKQVMANPKVEMCYIDRKMRFVRITGQAAVSKNKEKKELLWNNIPMLRQFFSGPDDENFTLLEINTSIVEIMTPNQREPEILSLK